MRLPREILSYGPSALLLNWEAAITPEINRSVHAYAAQVRQHPAVRECVPAYASLLVRFAPAQTTAYALREYLFSLQVAPLGKSAQITHRLPVCYHESLAPDLLPTAKALGLSPEQLINLHTQTVYRVYQLGFQPGFGFLGQTAPALAVSRLPEPRRAVPAGAVGLAGRQTGIYPAESPGGWRLIGRCPVPLLRPGADFARLHPGDIVHFHPVSLGDFSTCTKDFPWPKR